MFSLGTSSATHFIMQTSLLYHALGFTLGYWWICHQLKIEPAKVLRSLLGGFILGFAGLYAMKYNSQVSWASQLSPLPVAGLLGAVVLLWAQAREQLAQKIDRDSVYLLTLTFMYFFSPFKGEFKIIGLLCAAPCLLVLLFCFNKKHIESSEKVGLMFWTMLVSLTIGLQQLWSSPESLVPVKKGLQGMSTGSYTLSAALAAAGLVTLAFSLIPFIDWFRGWILGGPSAADHEMMNDTFSVRRTLVLTCVHGLPLLANWKFQFCTRETMVGFALVWSPMLSAMLADALEPEVPAEIPGWEEDASQVS